MFWHSLGLFMLDCPLIYYNVANIYWVYHCFQCLMYINSFSPHDNPVMMCYYYPHFTVQGTERSNFPKVTWLDNGGTRTQTCPRVCVINHHSLWPEHTPTLTPTSQGPGGEKDVGEPLEYRTATGKVGAKAPGSDRNPLTFHYRLKTGPYRASCPRFFGIMWLPATSCS